jgi:CRISPR-associated endonuclease/helicase Cas3
MGDLANNWRTTFLFCTATQPAFEKKTAGDKKDVRWEPKTLTEVMEKPGELFESLKRVEVEWPGPAPTPWVDIAQRMISSRRALCIVNVREHASKLHSLLGKQGAFHLSTRMCAADRLAVIHSIRERLKDPEADCLVAATQLVEAGVDLDFPMVFRALGPLDAIIQAAGRCDREGKLTLALGKPGGRLIVFRTEDGKTPPGIYKDATGKTEDYLNSGRISLHDPLLVRDYFHRLYTEGRDLGKAVEDARTKLQFPTVAREFDYIANYTEDVYVPYDENACRLIAQLRAVGFLLPELRRGLQRYTVGLRPNEIAAARVARLERFRLRNTKTEQEVWICREGYYRRGFGIVLETSVSEYSQ